MNYVSFSALCPRPGSATPYTLPSILHKSHECHLHYVMQENLPGYWVPVCNLLFMRQHNISHCLPPPSPLHTHPGGILMRVAVCERLLPPDAGTSARHDIWTLILVPTACSFTVQWHTPQRHWACALCIVRAQVFTCQGLSVRRRRNVATFHGAAMLPAAMGNIAPRPFCSQMTPTHCSIARVNYYLVMTCHTLVIPNSQRAICWFLLFLLFCSINLFLNSSWITSSFFSLFFSFFPLFVVSSSPTPRHWSSGVSSYGAYELFMDEMMRWWDGMNKVLQLLWEFYFVHVDW